MEFLATKNDLPKEKTVENMGWKKAILCRTGLTAYLKNNSNVIIKLLFYRKLTYLLFYRHKYVTIVMQLFGEVKRKGVFNIFLSNTFTYKS